MAQRVNNTMKEIWKPIVGCDGMYEVSNKGRIKSCRRFARRQIGKILNPVDRGLGYRNVCLYKSKTNKRLYRVHQLVAQAFIPNLENKPYVNHIDNNPSNNHVSNLEWCTPKENYNHSKKQDRNVKGEKVGGSKLTKEKVLEIRKIYEKDFPTYKNLGKMFNISNTMASYIVRKIWWKHV